MIIAKSTVKATIKGIKLTVKAVASAIKTIIAGIKALVMAIIAGGWIAVIIIIVICLVALLCSSIYGIFFSSENRDNGKTMSAVISEINNNYMTKITDIQNNTPHNEYDITSNRANWKDVLAVYAVKESKGKDDVELMTLSEERIKTLKDTFWEMNSISSNTEKVSRDFETIDENGNKKTETKEITILHIVTSKKSIEDMKKKYKFNAKQIKQLEEISKKEYDKMWNMAIYGSSSGSSDIVEVAKQQIGNVGGQPYWSWYGFESRVDWCACFVSWCANQCGYIEKGVIPKFAGCEKEGVSWFKTCGLWQDGGYIPKSRRYNIF